MADLPYLVSYKNVGTLFERILAAKQPAVFNHKFLTDTLGLKSTNDRPLIPLLRTLGFIDAGGKPTPDYAFLKNPSKRGAAIAVAVSRAYAPLFASNENAHNLSSTELRGQIAQVAGADAAMTTKIAGTFGALAKLADFSAPTQPTEEAPAEDIAKPPDRRPSENGGALRPEFHYNIQVHLPSNASEETYINIFNALRRTLL